MSGFGWQDATVAALAVLALAWLIRQRLRSRRGPTPFCDSCPGCASVLQASGDASRGNAAAAVGAGAAASRGCACASGPDGPSGRSVPGAPGTPSRRAAPLPSREPIRFDFDSP